MTTVPMMKMKTRQTVIMMHWAMPVITAPTIQTRDRKTAMRIISEISVITVPQTQTRISRHYPPDGNTSGDACECEGNFDCDVDRTGEMPRPLRRISAGVISEPLTNELPCNGDFDCDSDVDGTDAALVQGRFWQEWI